MEEILKTDEVSTEVTPEALENGEALTDEEKAEAVANAVDLEGVLSEEDAVQE